MKLYQALLFFSFLFHRGTEGSLFEKFDECEEEANKTSSPIQSTTESSKHDMIAETVNISDILLSNMRYISNQFRLNYRTSFQEWLPSFENTTIKTNMKLEYDNYSISFSDITVTKYYEPLFSSVDCEFHEYLQVKIPSMESQLRFRGDIYMNENRNRTIRGQFVITFNDIFATITIQKNLTDGVLSHLFNQMQINVDYKNFAIELNVDEDHEMVASKGIDALTEELESYTKSTLKEKLISKFNSFNQSSLDTESFSAMYDSCIHPESRIVKAHPGFDSTSKYYYHAKKAVSDKWGSTNLTIHTFKVKGLHDYKSFKSDAIFLQEQREWSLNFTWSLGEIRGYANWSYSSPLDSRQFNGLQFKIRDIKIMSDKVSTRSRLREGVNIIITSTPSIACARSNSSLATFAGVTVLQQIESIIYRDISNAF